MLHAYSLGTMFIGFVAAALSAGVAVTWMMRFLRSRGLAMFGYYRIALAIGVMALIWRGHLTP